MTGTAPDELAPLRPFDPAAVGSYRLLGRLGSGGMGEVYLGRDGSGRLAAVKLVHDAHAGDPVFRARFAREVAVARSVRVAWSAAVVAADPAAPVPWLATEYIPGPSLEELVAAEGPLSAAAVGTLASGLAAALAELHALDVVHRDVKPSNVLIAAAGPRLIDFGIARAADATAITRTGSVLGAPGFMSPEQALGIEAGPASDVFSLAAVAVHAATGRGPFGESASPVALLRRIVDEPPDLDELPDDLRPVLEPCLAKDPAARPTAAELAARLADRRGPGEQWPPTGRARLVRRVPAVPAGRWLLNRRQLLGVAAVGAAAVAGAVALRRVSTAPPTPGSVATGTIRWSTVLPDAEPTWHLVHSAGTVIADTRNQLHGLDSRTGALRWSAPTFAGQDTDNLERTLCAGDGVYSNNGRGIFALDAATGRLRWEQDGGELLHAGETLLLGRSPAGPATGAGELLGIDPATGTTRWRYQNPDQEEHDLPVVATPGRLHVGLGRGLTTFDPASGAVLWSVPWPVRYATTGLTAHGDAVLVATAGELVSVDAASGALRWAHEVRNSSAGPPIVHGGSVFLIGLDRLRVLDAGTGRPLWDVEPAGEFDMALAAAGDAVYAIEKSVGRSRRAIEVRSYGLAAGELRWTVPLAGAGGWLGLRNFTAADGVICLGLDMQAPHPAVYGFEP